MRTIKLILMCVFGSLIVVQAQTTVVEKSGKKPNWATQLERGFIVGIGNASTLEQAKETSMLNVKAQIVSSVADNISTSSELKNTEMTSDKIVKSFQSYSSLVTSKSGKQDYLLGISPTNIAEIYWEKLLDKKTKNTSYQYFIKYPFSSLDLKKLVDDFIEKDNQLTEELNKTLARLENYTSIEEIKECQTILGTYYQTFIDQRKTKAKLGIDKCITLLESVIIENEGSTLGVVRYFLSINNRRVTCSLKPTLKAECAIIEDRKIGAEICELRYRYDECYGDNDNKIKVSYPFGNGKTDRLFYFDITENKADLSLIGTIRIGEGIKDGDSMTNATCKLELSSKFESPVTVTNVTFEWKQYGVICDMPVNQTISGKGVHVIELSISRLPISVISTLSHPENKLNGSVSYTAGNGKQNKIRIYQKDYITAW